MCVYVCLYVCVYARIHVCMFACLCMYKHTGILMYKCICTYMYMYMYMYVYIYMYMYVYVYVYVCVCLCMHACMRTLQKSDLSTTRSRANPCNLRRRTAWTAQPPMHLLRKAENLKTLEAQWKSKASWRSCSPGSRDLQIKPSDLDLTGWNSPGSRALGSLGSASMVSGFLSSAPGHHTQLCSEQP